MIARVQITKYKTTDGTLFDYEADALGHEEQYLAVKPILDQMPMPKLAHGQHVKVGKELLMQIRRDLWHVVLRFYGESRPKWKEWNADEVHPASIVGRVLDDYGGAVAEAWSRLLRFNFEHGTIHDQPYFASHFSESKEVAI